MCVRAVGRRSVFLLLSVGCNTQSVRAVWEPRGHSTRRGSGRRVTKTGIGEQAMPVFCLGRPRTLSPKGEGAARLFCCVVRCAPPVGQFLKAAVLGEHPVIGVVRQRRGRGPRGDGAVPHGWPSMGAAPAVRACHKSAQPTKLSACFSSHTPRRAT